MDLLDSLSEITQLIVSLVRERGSEKEIVCVFDADSASVT